MASCSSRRPWAEGERISSSSSRLSTLRISLAHVEKGKFSAGMWLVTRSANQPFRSTGFGVLAAGADRGAGCGCGKSSGTSFSTKNPRLGRE